MKKDRLYLYNILTISFIVFFVGYISVNLLVKQSIHELLDFQINTSKRESKEFAKFISYSIDNNTDLKSLVNNIQKSIEGTNSNSGFISMINWSGIEVCHPNPKKIGVKTKSNSTFIKNNNSELNSKDLFNYIHRKIKNKKADTSEVIYLYPIKNTDWIIASHINMPVLQKKIHELRNYFLLVYLLTGLFITITIFFVIRIIGNYYEKSFEVKNKSLIDEVLNLTKLNANLNSQKSKIAEKDKIETTKKRVLTYLRDQLISIDVNNIAYIYTENSITKIACNDSKVYSSNSSLEELYNTLNNTRFFRANRQYIISITVIDKILQYGKNQLKIVLKPEFKNNLIISKNKASEFKKWLNQ